MTLRDQIKNSIKTTLLSSHNMAEQLLDNFSRLPDAEILFILEVLYTMMSGLKSWQNFLIEVLSLNEDKKVVVHYPGILAHIDDDPECIYNVTASRYDHCIALLDYFAFENWLSEIRLYVDSDNDCLKLIDYITSHSKFDNVKIILHSNHMNTDIFEETDQIKWHKA